MMSYDPARQNRTAFIRGRGKRDLDDLILPLAEVVNALTPCDSSTYRQGMLAALDELLPGESRSPKTLNNWTTEIVDKLFGLIVHRGDAVQVSARAERLLASKDQIGFFRELVYRFQVPFYGGKPQSWDDQGYLSVRPGVFCVQVLLEARRSSTVLTTDELKFYVLNSLDVQRGSAQPANVVSRIVSDRRRGRPASFPVPTGSYDSQHLNEFIGFLELAALVHVSANGEGEGGHFVHLNTLSEETLSVFANEDPNEVTFQRDASEDASRTMDRWSDFWTSIPNHVEQAFYGRDHREAVIASEASVSTDTLAVTGSLTRGLNNLDVGTLGENLVMKFEALRLDSIHPTLKRHLKNRSAERNIGYDIQSVRGTFADHQNAQEQYIYIEVKTSRRATRVTTLPRERITMTSNEWNQAQSVRDAYFIYQVYLTADGVQVFVIQNPAAEEAGGRIRVTPSQYSVHYVQPTAFDFVLDE